MEPFFRGTVKVLNLLDPSENYNVDFTKFSPAEEYFHNRQEMLSTEYVIQLWRDDSRFFVTQVIGKKQYKG